MDNFALVILAAGPSSRMGQSKQLLPWQDATLVTHSMKTAMNSRAASVTVVLGAREEEHRRVVEEFPVTIVSNPGWRNGMGSSLKAGLAHLLRKTPPVDGLVVMVCDQPFVTTLHINALIDSFATQRKGIIASGYHGTAGVPALFGRSVFEKLWHMDDGEGAKKLILAHPQDDLVVIDFPGAAWDLDTMEDYEKLKDQL